MTVTKEQASEALNWFDPLDAKKGAPDHRHYATLRQFIEQSASQDSGQAPAPIQPHPSDERAAFEAWHVQKFGRAYSQWVEAKGRYAWDLTQELWSAWQARAALAGASPTPQPGWKLVPVEPTPEMCAAAEEQKQYDHRRGTVTVASNIYRAMLAASPTQAGEQPTDARDAARYRFLRNGAWNNRTHPQIREHLMTHVNREALDAAIDAAMQVSSVSSGVVPQQPVAAGVPETPAQRELNDKIDAWHSGAGEGKPLHEFLGMTRDEFARRVVGAHGVRVPDGGQRNG